MAEPPDPSTGPRLARRTFLAAGLALGLSACAGVSLPGRKLTRVGLMAGVKNDSNVEAFKKALADAGYVEGKSVEFVERYTGDTGLAYDDMADDLVKQGVNAVATTIDYSTALSRLSPMPVILLGTVDPVGSGFAQSLDHPNGNITGVLSRPTSGLLRIHVELLQELIPNLHRVTFVPTFTPRGQIFGEPPFAVPNILGITGVQVHTVPNRLGTTLGNPEGLFLEAARNGAEAVVVAIGVTQPERLADMAASQHLPVLVQGNLEYARKAKGLLSQAVDMDDIFRRGGNQLAKILDGARPGEVPFEQPDKMDLVVNVSTARDLGLTVPKEVLNQATEVVQ